MRQVLRPTADDWRSAEGQRFLSLLEVRLAKHRGQLEGDQSHDTTTKLRGRIAELKELLALAAPANADAPDDAAPIGGF